MKLLKEETKLFTYIDSDFENWGVDDGIKTTGVKLKAIKQDKDFVFKDVFNTETDCVSQSDIIDWINENQEDIKKVDTWKSYFFLLKNSNEKFFVASMYVYSDGSVYVHVYDLPPDDEWRASSGHRIVVPATSPTVLSNSKLNTQTLNPLVGKILEKHGKEIEQAILEYGEEKEAY